MKAIEIYTEVMKLVSGEKYQDVSVALNFVRDTVDKEYWGAQERANRSGFSAGAAGGQIAYLNQAVAQKDYIIGSMPDGPAEG